MRCIDPCGGVGVYASPIRSHALIVPRTPHSPPELPPSGWGRGLCLTLLAPRYAPHSYSPLHTRAVALGGVEALHQLPHSAHSLTKLAPLCSQKYSDTPQFYLPNHPHAQNESRCNRDLPGTLYMRCHVRAFQDNHDSAHRHKLRP